MMHTLTYNALKVLRTDPKNYLNFKESSSEAFIVSTLLLNEELFQDLFYIDADGPQDESIRLALDGYAHHVNAIISKYEEISDELLTEYQNMFFSKLVTTREEIDKILVDNEKYFFNKMSTTKSGISKKRYEELDKLKKLLAPQFSINKLEPFTPVKFGASKAYINKDKNFEVYCLVEQILQVNVPFMSMRRALQIRPEIDMITVDHKGKTITVKSIVLLENVIDFKTHFKKERLDLKVGLDLQLCQMKDYKVFYKFIACDGSACCTFTFAKATLDKIRKTIIDELAYGLLNLIHGDFRVPGEYTKEYIL